jgi:hypothetical protein
LAVLALVGLGVGIAMGLTAKLFFDGLDALGPLTARLGPTVTLLLYALAWAGVVALVVWSVRRVRR